MSVLKGEHLILRPIEKKDLANLNKWKNTEEVYKNLGGGFMPVSIDIQEKWLDNLMDTTGNNKRFIMEDLAGKSIGMIGLYNINWIHRTCEWGVFIGETSEQGKGYGPEAYNLLEDFARKYLNLRKIKAFVVADNDKITKTCDRQGFIKAGELQNERFINGEYHSVYILEKIISE